MSPSAAAEEAIGLPSRAIVRHDGAAARSSCGTMEPQEEQHGRAKAHARCRDRAAAKDLRPGCGALRPRDGPADRVWFTGGRVWLGARAHGRILDVAVGTGLTLPHYPADASVTGIDTSAGMLAIARRRAAALVRPIELHRGDAEQLPFADAFFDTVGCALALCCVPDPTRAIGEMQRMLVPGGRRALHPPLAAARAARRAHHRRARALPGGHGGAAERARGLAGGLKRAAAERPAPISRA